ncbi:MAG: nuclear transport factor 2 family protein [Pseudomonadales bacterium]
MPDPYREIENLLYIYADKLDRGDLEGVAELFRYGAIVAPAVNHRAEGREQVLARYQGSTRIYADTGTPKTQHVISNAVVTVNDATATCDSRFTVFQATDDLPLQAIITGRYHDQFIYRDDSWWFLQRSMMPEMFGDLSHHLLFDAGDIQREE